MKTHLCSTYIRLKVLRSLANLQLYDSEFQTEGALMLKAFVDNASTIWCTESNDLSNDCYCRSLECRHTGCSSASEFDSADTKHFPNAVNGPSIASVLTSASNSLPQFDYDGDDSVYCMSSPCDTVDNTNSKSMSSLTPQETVLNRSNAFRMAPPTNGVVPTQSDVTYRSTASCQICRNLRDKCTVRLLPTVAEQTIWMPSSTDISNRVSEHSPVSADQIVDNSAQLSNLSLDVGRTNSLSDHSSSSSSSEM